MFHPLDIIYTVLGPPCVTSGSPYYTMNALYGIRIAANMIYLAADTS